MAVACADGGLSQGLTLLSGKCLLGHPWRQEKELIGIQDGPGPRDPTGLRQLKHSGCAFLDMWCSARVDCTGRRLPVSMCAPL